MMSRICLCCLADQNLVVLGDEEWRIYDLILNLSKKNVFNYKFFLEELKSSNAGRICSKCQYTLTYVEKFRRNTCLNFQKLLDIWNESGASTSYSKINVDPLESEEVFIKSDPDDDDDDDKNSSKEDDQNECLMETAPSSPSTVSVKSDDIKRIKEEALDSEVENESFETDMETQINSAVITKNAVDTSLQLKGSPIQGVRVTAKTFAANDPNQKRSPIQKVPVTANNSASKDPQQTRSLIQRVIVTPATSESNDLKQARLPFQGVRVAPNEPKPTRAPIHEVRVMTNTSASGNLEQTRLELRGGISVTVGSATSADNPDPTRDKGKRVIYSENYKRVRPDGCQCRLCHPEAYKPEPPGPPRKFPCPICHKEFTSRGSLWSHKYNMHQDNKVYCEPCDEWFKQARYKMHLRISAKHNEEVNIRVTCEECKKPVIKAFLKRHMDSHKRTRYCKTCDKWFTKAGYKTHMTSNLKHVTRDDFKYSCDICKGKFVTITATERHMQIIHLKLLPYKCPHCPAAYKYRGTLTKHVLTVHEKKPVPKKCICHVCGAAWETECLLKNHMVVHTGERPYKCKVCDATFGFSGALYTHNKLKHLKKKRDTRTQTKERKTKRNAKKK